MLAGFDRIVYPVIDELPLYKGAAHDTVAWPVPLETPRIIGCVGTAAGTTALDAVEGSEFPAAFTAVTVKV
jgi:hypothetical protein